jgi:hypothetical protein
VGNVATSCHGSKILALPGVSGHGVCGGNDLRDDEGSQKCISLGSGSNEPTGFIGVQPKIAVGIKSQKNRRKDFWFFLSTSVEVVSDAQVKFHCTVKKSRDLEPTMLAELLGTPQDAANAMFPTEM